MNNLRLVIKTRRSISTNITNETIVKNQAISINIIDVIIVKNQTISIVVSVVEVMIE